MREALIHSSTGPMSKETSLLPSLLAFSQEEELRR